MANRRFPFPKYKKALVSSALFYEGWNNNRDALDSDETWQIMRTVIDGGITEELMAGLGQFEFSWTDRATYFTAPSLFNEYSTFFDGINDYATGGNIFNYDHSNQFSMSGWVWVDNFASQRCIFSKVTADASVNGFSCQVNTSGNVLVQMRAAGGAVRTFTGSTVLASQTWYHICITYAGGSNMNGLRVYINGAVEATPGSAAFGASWLASQSFIIGNRNTSFPFSGYIDEFTVWNKALSASEVSQLYNSGMPTEISTMSFASNCVSWYRMGDNDIYPTIFDHIGSNNLTLVGGSASNFQLVVP